MIEKTLAKRYATALLEVNHREGTVEDTESTLLALKSVYEKDARFRSVLGSPKVSRAQKKDLLRKALAGASTSLQEFMGLLVEKRRTDLIPDIADMYDRLADATKGVVRVQVKSAFPLKPDQESKLRGELERLTGKKIEIEASADRALRGGMLVMIGDSVVDGTLANRLKGLREQLNELQKR